jgi:hypothetical protein
VLGGEQASGRMNHQKRRVPGGRAERSALLKALVMILGIVGQVLGLSRSNFMSGTHFLYYTNISNLFVIALMAVLLIRVWRAPDRQLPPWLAAARMALSAGILLTFAAFTLLLLPLLSADYLLSPDNLLVHYLVPLLACLDFVLFPDSPPHPRPRCAWGLLLPLTYFLFSICLTQSGVRMHGGYAPYVFLDYKTYGWFAAGGGNLGVFWWFLILLGLQLLLGKVLLGLRDLTARSLSETQLT